MKVRWSDHSPSPQSHRHQCQCWVCSESSSSVGSMSNCISCCNKSICFCPTFIIEWSLSIRNPLLLAIEAVTVDDSLRFIGAGLLAQLQSMDRTRTERTRQPPESWPISDIYFLPHVFFESTGEKSSLISLIRLMQLILIRLCLSTCFYLIQSKNGVEDVINPAHSHSPIMWSLPEHFSGVRKDPVNDLINFCQWHFVQKGYTSNTSLAKEGIYCSFLPWKSFNRPCWMSEAYLWHFSFLVFILCWSYSCCCWQGRRTFFSVCVWL